MTVTAERGRGREGRSWAGLICLGLSRLAGLLFDEIRAMLETPGGGGYVAGVAGVVRLLLQGRESVEVRALPLETNAPCKIQLPRLQQKSATSTEYGCEQS